ncbi:hypothetical protein MMAD_04900 [Mycolicibacterium madagascariense]|uniref:Uncharacterized protein n=1 Tax=Mycolicibacterium madagascariense TaxID=212765 RepID=A0A7I7XA58_9MYCO|nr:hypothetical protein [Mycolicibacterium madagascariense]MCV7011952.1 hypothetical protein [Mycolicibacterium madagascariense]BBZ26195.1 hypothetical protein MMAD_04900 [Mycolicibacterium madagascariense]
MTPVVLVVGPSRAGVGGVVAALRTRLPDVEVVEGPPPRAPDAVLAVVSAAAPMTRSQWADVERASAGSGLLVGVVAKIDAHRQWRDVVAANRDGAERWGSRTAIPWVGAAAAPVLGDADVDELVRVLRAGLARPPIARAVRAAVSASDVLARTRLRLVRSVRDGASALRTELRAAAATVPPGGAQAFEVQVRARVEVFLKTVDRDVADAVGEAAAELGCGDRVAVPRGHACRLEPSDAGRPTSSRRLEARLAAVLGLGFGVGTALAVGRLVAGWAPGVSTAGLVAGAVMGLALGVWVVRTRRLLHDRAVLDRWVADVAGTVRWHAEARVAEWLLSVASAGRDAGPRVGSRATPEGPAGSLKQVTDQYEWRCDG